MMSFLYLTVSVHHGSVKESCDLATQSIAISCCLATADSSEPCIAQSVNQSIHPSINQIINLSTNQAMQSKQSIN